MRPWSLPRAGVRSRLAATIVASAAPGMRAPRRRRCRGRVSGVGDASAPAIQPPKVPLQTQSRFIVDSAGQRLLLAGVNWYGAESSLLIPLTASLCSRSRRSPGRSGRWGSTACASRSATSSSRRTPSSPTAPSPPTWHCRGRPPSRSSMPSSTRCPPRGWYRSSTTTGVAATGAATRPTATGCGTRPTTPRQPSSPTGRRWPGVTATGRWWWAPIYATSCAVSSRPACPRPAPTATRRPPTASASGRPGETRRGTTAIGPWPPRRPATPSSRFAPTG